MSTHECLWLVKGTGQYWGNFYVSAPNALVALGKAKDILAGADKSGQRHYGTADMEIMAIEATGLHPLTLTRR